MSVFTDKYFVQKPIQRTNKNLPVRVALHLNEMPIDIPEDLRKCIIDRVKRISLNRYPEPFGDSLVQKLADWYGYSSSNIMIAPGSSAFIRLLLTYFGTHIKGKLVITRPSFIYYEQYCLAFQIPYETWELDKNFDYDISKLDNLSDYSVVFLTSPNNPTGNVLSLGEMKSLLVRHRKSLFIVDEAYVEFADSDMLPLLKKFENIVLLRTFSKAFCAAGIRCGILLGEKALVSSLNALQTPWQLSSFTIETAKEIVSYEKETKWFKSQVEAVIKERENLLVACKKVLNDNRFTIFPSKANFVLIRSKNWLVHNKLLASCVKHGILVNDLNYEPRLSNCLRVSIGKPRENTLFLQAFRNSMKGN